MGLIKAIGGAIGGVLADEWKEFFYCEALPVDVLMQKGSKRVDSNRSSNTKASDNIISDGSMIAVADGQCMIIVQQGEIVEYCAEPGEFKWDASAEPSLFNGNLGDSLAKTFSVIGRRFTTGGDTARDQRVYFFNTKEIVGNKYGTVNPVPFRVVDKNCGLDMDIAIKCNGEYSYKLTDPLLFYKNVCGNQAESYTRDELDSQLKSELLTALQPAFAKVSAAGIRYSQLPGQATEMADILNDELSEKWHDLRGIEIVSFGINTVKAPEEDEKMIKELQRAAASKDPTMAAARLTDAQAEAMQEAAKNENAGSVMAFAGLNMATNAGGANANELFDKGAAQNAAAAAAQPAADQAAAAQPAAAEGAAIPAIPTSGAVATAAWTCECGASNTGKFCSECGKPAPASVKYKCNKCGWEPKEGEPLPKFCPECGDPFDENDKA